jgi:hypothetical protein
MSGLLICLSESGDDAPNHSGGRDHHDAHEPTLT